MTNDRPFIVIFTDLDGTLLDPVSYGWEEANPALHLCKRFHIPIVLVSSKTRAEMDVIREKLGLGSPFISENGGGIFFPAKKPYKPPTGIILANNLWTWSLGPSYDVLVTALKEIREELGWKIRGFSEMAPKEISQLTGLDLKTSRLAATREHDEPFVVLDQENIDEEALRKAARQRGLTITTGGRFHHLHDKFDKGVAVGKLISWYKGYHPRLLTIALGDSPNDFSMLKRVNHPVLIRSTRQFPDIQEVIPGLRFTRDMGPKGWNSAVSDILRSIVPGSH